MHLRHKAVDTASYMHENGTWHRAIRGPDKALGRDLAVIMGDEREQVALPFLDPGRLALEEHVLKRNLGIPGHRRLPRRVEPFETPTRKLFAEEVDEMLLRSGLPGCTRHPRNEDRRQQFAVIDGEVVAAGWHELEETVRERRVGECQRRKP